MENQIFESGEYCEKCFGVENVGTLEMQTGGVFYICGTCYDDEAGLKKWFEAEIEKALEASDDWEKLPDGKWRQKTEGL